MGEWSHPLPRRRVTNEARPCSATPPWSHHTRAALGSCRRKTSAEKNDSQSSAATPARIRKNARARAGLRRWPWIHRSCFENACNCLQVRACLGLPPVCWNSSLRLRGATTLTSQRRTCYVETCSARRRERGQRPPLHSCTR